MPRNASKAMTPPYVSFRSITNLIPILLRHCVKDNTMICKAHSTYILIRYKDKIYNAQTDKTLFFFLVNNHELNILWLQHVPIKLGQVLKKE